MPPATPEFYTLSLHDALPISTDRREVAVDDPRRWIPRTDHVLAEPPVRAAAASTWSVRDRKSTRLNSSHVAISYAVFCLKKKKTTTMPTAKRKRFDAGQHPSV